MSKITFDWRINIGTVITLLAILIQGILVGAIGLYRIKSLEDSQIMMRLMLDRHTEMITVINLKLDHLQTLIEERTRRPATPQ